MFASQAMSVLIAKYLLLRRLVEMEPDALHPIPAPVHMAGLMPTAPSLCVLKRVGVAVTITCLAPVAVPLNEPARIV